MAFERGGCRKVAAPLCFLAYAVGPVALRWAPALAFEG